MNDEKLVHYFISETNKKFDEIKRELEKLNGKVTDLHQFKVETVAVANSKAKWTSAVVSTVIGILSFFSSYLIQLFYNKP